ncbi:FHA domain-containing protein [Candidatus Saccharibacteria bacterium]|nr:FHA domain-containing protein [Candidatus Saccharibacteria bacterium]
MKKTIDAMKPFGDYGVETRVPVYEPPEGHHPMGGCLPLEFSQLELIADIDEMRQPLIVRVGSTALQVTKNQRNQTITTEQHHLPYTGLYEMPNTFDELYITNLGNYSEVHSTAPTYSTSDRIEHRKNIIQVGRDWHDHNQIFQKGRLYIPDNYVSRQHALIGLTDRAMRVRSGKVFALDLASTNGTSVIVHEMDADKIAVTNPFEENPFS